MHSTSGLRAAAATLLCALLGLSGCVLPPASQAQPLTPRSLDLVRAACGEAAPSPAGDTSFAAVLTTTDAAGMRMTLDVAARGGAHGEHELGLARMWVVDDGDLVAGALIADAWRELDGLHGTLEVELGACPDADADADAAFGPLADGDYTLLVSGGIAPIDHVHAQQELWLAESIDIRVSDGSISLR